MLTRSRGSAVRSRNSGRTNTLTNDPRAYDSFDKRAEPHAAEVTAAERRQAIRRLRRLDDERDESTRVKLLRHIPRLVDCSVH
ncbi:unnamed protein product [Soboliphyme baturini]|uniref:BHLH domain-containing protein n=1 Tax=Soboliphyme baturini TaxID=241478 RepID=A0A183IIG4_9BILA|nr:unnamed protein product [Soboliphyme baturini]